MCPHPKRPLPDLCLISVFKALKPNDQLKASRISLRCAILVRAANRKVKTLIVGLNKVWINNIRDIICHIKYYSIMSNSANAQVTTVTGQPFPDYPLTVSRVNVWQCLLLDNCILDEDDVAIITNVFSAVTDLKILAPGIDIRTCLVPLLLHPNWAGQLTNLLVQGYFEVDAQIPLVLTTAINGLVALEHLAIDWTSETELGNLTIFSQLKTFASNSCRIQSVLRSIELNAVNNVDLKIHLSCNTRSLLTLGETVRDRVVCLHYLKKFKPEKLSVLCNAFQSLVSISMVVSEVEILDELFSSLCKLDSLVRLKLLLTAREGAGVSFQTRPKTQLKTLQYLDLNLSIESHSQIIWLNLSHTMPKLHTLCIGTFSCKECQIPVNTFTDIYYNFDPSPLLRVFGNCLQQIHQGISTDRCFYKYIDKCFSVQDLTRMQSTGSSEN